MGINSFQKSHIQTLNGERLSGPQSESERQTDRGKRRTMILQSWFYYHQDSAKVGSLPMSPWLTRKPSIKDRWFDNWQIQIISLICLALCIFPFLVYLKEREKKSSNILGIKVLFYVGYLEILQEKPLTGAELLRKPEGLNP